MSKPKNATDEKFNVELLRVTREDGSLFYVGGQYPNADYDTLVAIEAIIHKKANEPLLKIGMSRCDGKKLKEILDAAGVDLQ